MIGKVVSTRTPRMVIVSVTRIRRHPIYKKPVRKARRFAVHNESFDLTLGDRVEISQIKPMSKTKHFTVVKKL